MTLKAALGASVIMSLLAVGLVLPIALDRDSVRPETESIIVALIFGDGSIDVLRSLPTSNLMEPLATAPAAQAAVVEVLYQGLTVVQRLKDGAVRVLTLDDDKLEETIIWRGSDIRAQQAQAIAIVDGGVAFLLPGGAVRATKRGLGRAATPLILLDDAQATSGIAGGQGVLFYATASHAVTAVDPDDPELTRQIRDESAAEVVGLTASGSQLLVGLADGGLVEYDHASGTTTELVDATASRSFGVFPDGGSQWFVTTAPDQISFDVSNGITTYSAIDAAPPQAVHGIGDVAIVVTEAGDVLGFGFPAQPEGHRIAWREPPVLFSAGVLDARATSQ